MRHMGVRAWRADRRARCDAAYDLEDESGEGVHQPIGPLGSWNMLK